MSKFRIVVQPKDGLSDQGEKSQLAIAHAELESFRELVVEYQDRYNFDGTTNVVEMLKEVRKKAKEL